MAVAFGIEYGLAEIAQANQAITRELENQKRIYDDLATRARGQGYGAKTPFALGAGQAVDSNVIDRRFDEKVDAAIDKRIRKTTARDAGSPFGGGLAGRVRNVGDIAQLLQGGVSSRNIHGALEIGAEVFGGSRAAGLMGSVGRSLGPLAAVGATAGAIMALTYKAFAEPPKALMEAIGGANKAFLHLQKQFRDAGVRLNQAPIDTGMLGGGEISQAFQLQGFQGRMELSANLAKNVYEASGALMAADPKDAARFLNLPGQQSKSSVRYYIRQMLTQGTTLGLLLAAKDMEQTLGRIKKREEKQAAYFDSDPIAASRLQEQQRIIKWKNDQEAHKLRDWSRT